MNISDESIIGVNDDSQAISEKLLLFFANELESVDLFIIVQEDNKKIRTRQDTFDTICQF